MSIPVLLNSAPTTTQLAGQSPTKYSPSRSALTAINVIRARIFQATIPLRYLDQALIRTLLISGCRISEALALKLKHISQCGLINIPAAKKSNPRVVFDNELAHFLLSLSRNNNRPLISLSYKQAYLICKKCVSDYQLNVYKNRTVATHWFRYSYVATLYGMSTLSIEDISNIVGHKAISSTNIYLRRLENG